MLKFENLNVTDAIMFLYKNKELNELHKFVLPFNKLKLLEGGENLEENYQIFTPEFIVRDMVHAIGEDEVSNAERTIFEPASGDGAFTTYILKLRLEKALENKETFIANMFRSISTIYSVEMDKELIARQRCNIYTLLSEFLQTHQIELSAVEDELVKYMIVTNFIWGMTNIEYPISASLFGGKEVVYKMPVKKSYEAIEFPVWTITDDLTISLHYEGVD